MTTTMLAERFYADGRRVEVEEIPIPEPGPGQVRVKVAYCGICHSDLSLINGAFPDLLPVVTQGHEAAGTIDKIGPGVTGWELGDKVIPSAGRPCLTCRRCRRGDFANCLDLQLMAFAYDGGWAQYTIANATGMTRIPDDVDLKQAAILADAVSTPFGAVVRTGKVHPGNAVAVWGLGGVGTHIVQLAKLAGAVPIIGIDINDESLERAKRLGADYVFRADDENLLDSITKATGGRMVDVAFDAVGISSTLRQAVASLDNNGKAVAVGMSAQDMNLGSFLDFNLHSKQVLGHLGYQTQDIAMLTEMLAYGRLDLTESISEIVSLRDIKVGIDHLERKVGNPIRILVDPWA
ncbi:zinc-binding dehydrogenase [Arcanobacterium haemolyticum]|nr:zinc-binding dehydrogenase [Arcanobacterium haemolyticum]